MSIRSKSLITVTGIVCLLLAYSGLVDETSMEYTERGFKRTLITYGIARGLNGVISVAQGTELAVEPVGIGLTFTPGEILNPVNDLIERFSWVVLVSGTAMGIQKVLLEITMSQGFTLFVSISVILAMCLLWWKGRLSHGLKQFFYRMAAVMLVLRFSVPFIALTGETLYESFLVPTFTASSEQLQHTSLILNDLNQQTQAGARIKQGEELSFFESTRQRLLSLTDNVNIQERIDAFKTAAENISEYTINLIVIFVFQTLLFPLLFAWLIIQLLKWLVSGNLFIKEG